MYKPQPSRRLGFWFSAYQVLKWRGGDVVNTWWFQPTHMPLPATATSPPSPSKPPPPSLNSGKSGLLHHPWFESKSRVTTTWNDALRTQMKVNGWYTPLPYPDEVTSEHGASAASVPHQSCTTHPVKNSWGDHIYGIHFPWSDWFQNCFESKRGDPWYY